MSRRCGPIFRLEKSRDGFSGPLFAELLSNLALAVPSQWRGRCRSCSSGSLIRSAMVSSQTRPPPPDHQDSGLRFLGPLIGSKNPATQGPRRSRLARANHAANPLLGVKQQTTKARDRNKTVQIGVVLDFLVRIPTIVLDRKPGQDNGIGQHVEDDDEVRVDPENH
jgi:hypothetical protein